MRRHYRAISIVVVFALVLASASTAWAYFTTTGRGLGSGSIASLSAPSAPNVSAAGATVTIIWNAITDPGDETFGYYVTRTPYFFGSPALACGSSPTSLLPASPTSCTDTSVPPGSYTYAVTVVYNTWSSTSPSSSEVLVGSQTITFTSANPTPVTVGTTYTPVATATSGLTVTLTIDSTSTPEACSLSSGVVSFTGVGTCLVDADQAGNAHYSAAVQVQQSITIGKATPTVWISNIPTSTSYGGSFTPTVSVTPVGDTGATSVTSNSTSVCTVSGSTVNFLGVGMCSLTTSVAGNSDYTPASNTQTFSMGQATPTVWISNIPTSTSSGAALPR